jgi:hypothetical protein
MTGAPLLQASPAMSELFTAVNYARRERGSVTRPSRAAPFASGTYVRWSTYTFVAHVQSTMLVALQYFKF